MPWFGGQAYGLITRGLLVVGSIPPCVPFETPLVRKAVGNRLIKSTSLEKSQGPVSGCSYAPNRVCDSGWNIFYFSYRSLSETFDFIRWLGLWTLVSYCKVKLNGKRMDGDWNEHCNETHRVNTWFHVATLTLAKYLPTAKLCLQNRPWCCAKGSHRSDISVIIDTFTAISW